MANERSAKILSSDIDHEKEYLSLLSTYVPIRVANLLSDVSAQQSDSNNPIESLPVVDKLRTCLIVVDFKCLLSKIYQGIRKNVSKEKYPTEQHRQSEPSKILGNICNKIAVACHDLGGDVVKYVCDVRAWFFPTYLFKNSNTTQIRSPRNSCHVARYQSDTRRSCRFCGHSVPENHN